MLEEGVGNIFCFNKHTIELLSSAMEPILQKVIAYVGHPVMWQRGSKTFRSGPNVSLNDQFRLLFR